MDFYFDDAGMLGAAPVIVPLLLAAPFLSWAGVRVRLPLAHGAWHGSSGSLPGWLSVDA